MSLFETRVGHVIRLTHFTNHSPELQTTFKADKKKVFVCLLLGTEARDASSLLDCEKVLNEMGWFKKEVTEPG